LRLVEGIVPPNSEYGLLSQSSLPPYLRHGGTRHEQQLESKSRPYHGWHGRPWFSHTLAAARGAGWHPGTKVVVNLFDGGLRDTLNFSLDNGTPRPMSYVIRTDPFAKHFRSNFPEYYGDKTRPAKSAHIWECDLPSNLEICIHTLEV